MSITGSYYLLNTCANVAVAQQPTMFQAGTLITDSTTLAAVASAGGVLWPSTDLVVAAMAVIVQKLRASRGQDEQFLSRAMLGAAQQGQGQVYDPTGVAIYPRFQVATTAAAVAGVTPALTSLYVGPNALVIPIPKTPGGTQGTPRVSTQTPGAPGASSIIITSSSGTDTSTFTVIVIN